MADIGNSNRIAREYIDSLRIETRYLDAAFPVTDFELYGARFSGPIMTAALSHLDHFMFPGAADALARGAKAAGAVLWYGMAEEAEIEALASVVPETYIIGDAHKIGIIGDATNDAYRVCLQIDGQ